jgi:hypothetical protein
MTRVDGMRDELPHDRAVLPEVADPVAVICVKQNNGEHERREYRVAQPVQCAQSASGRELRRRIPNAALVKARLKGI